MNYIAEKSMNIGLGSGVRNLVADKRLRLNPDALASVVDLVQGMHLSPPDPELIPELPPGTPERPPLPFYSSSAADLDLLKHRLDELTEIDWVELPAIMNCKGELKPSLMVLAQYYKK